MECYCYWRNIQDLLADDKTLCERRFCTQFEGPIVQFGAETLFHPLPPDDKGQLHQFGSTVLLGIFIGSVLHAEGFWTGDLYIVDAEDLNHNPTSFIHVKRFNAKEMEARTIQSQYKCLCEHCSVQYRKTSSSFRMPTPPRMRG